MSGMGQSIYDKGMAKGIEQGVMQSIRAFVLDNIDEHIPKERSIAKLQKLFGITREKAEEYYVTYADEI